MVDLRLLASLQKSLKESYGNKGSGHKKKSENCWESVGRCTDNKGQKALC